VLSSQILAASSSIQLPGLAEIIGLVHIPGDVRHVLILGLATKLKETTDGDPAFSVAMDGLALGERVIALARRDTADGYEGRQLLEAYRSYIIRNSSQVRCSDRVAIQHTLTKVGARNWLDEFNGNIRTGGYFEALQLPDLTMDDVRPRKVAAPGRTTSPDALTGAMQLRDRLNALADRDLGERSLSWQSDAEQLVTDISALPAPRELERLHAFTKYRYLLALLGIADSEKLMNQIIGAYVSSLEKDAIQNSDGTVWSYFVEQLMKLDDSSVQAARETKEDQQKIQRWVNSVKRIVGFRLTESSHPLLHVYGVLMTHSC
jgi:hypothetical protein